MHVLQHENRAVELRPYSFVQLPVCYMPPSSGMHMGTLLARGEDGTVHSLQLQGATKLGADYA